MKLTTPLFVVAALSAATSFAANKPDFAKDIGPVLAKSCIECHGPEKQKGKLRLDSKEAAFKGGDSGLAGIVPGKSADSKIYKAVTLPKGHDDIMPPKGEPLSKATTDLIKAWIDAGADWPAGVKLTAAGGPAEKKESDLGPGPKPTGAETKAVAELAKAGITAREIAQGSNWRYINLRVVGKKFDAKVWDQIRDVGNLIELNAGGVELTDSELAKVGKITNLRSLNLANATVKDSSLGALKGLANLTYLNLVGTQVTDAGLKQLAGLKKLKSVYLFESKVTDAGVAELKKALPNARIDNGADLKAFAAATAAKAEADKKAEEAKKAEAAAKKPAAPKGEKDDAKKKKKK
ncbi:MAG: c-type cytochrome domain-containing protein [Limisphaerales bacterium]